MATGLGNYVGWGGALADAYANTGLNSSEYVLSTTCTNTIDQSVCQGWYGAQGLFGNIGNITQQAQHITQQSIQKPIEKARTILESLRNEIHNWCANALEVA